jgi:hypothetical protein
MNSTTGYLICAAAVIAMLIAAGCVAPPTETSTGAMSTYNAAETPTETPTSSGYVTEVTAFVTTQNPDSAGSSTSGYHTFVTPTPLPGDKTCRIYTKTQAFSYNGTAFSFNLKNPPMYINYTVVPENITVNKATEYRYEKKGDVTYKFSTYDPQSYLEITVRNKTSGEIYLQDGFGSQYTTYLTRNLKVLKTDDLLIEIKGNKISGTINFWVKPDGNFENADNMTFDACTYWGGSSRDSTAVALVTATTTESWTPGRVIDQ